ncbi:L,D-transpeptidase family protein [Nonomuraea aridisoli]|uniref:L,D-transpeptidase family protein n=1 Tax=Nonomuraea aridisoli TaxID=2070368 RepID=UPI0015E8B164|nr:L,D-transpeptidase family protein [Nonomuraea aridisoli]
MAEAPVPAEDADAAEHELVDDAEAEEEEAERKPVVLRPGDRGAEVVKLQRRLNARGYYFGPVNGRYDEQTKFAVWALQKSRRIPVKGAVEQREWSALERPLRRRPMVSGGPADRVEVNLSAQLLTVYRDRRPVLFSHISSGAQVPYCQNGHCGNAVTPTGDFRVYRRAPGWTTGPLGAMYNSLYIVGGIALHGSRKVPLHPASHGCVRLPMTTSKRLYQIVKIGEPVYVRGKIR